MDENNNGTDNMRSPVKARKVIAFLLSMCIVGGVTIFSIYNVSPDPIGVEEGTSVDNNLPIENDQAVSNPVPVADSRSSENSSTAGNNSGQSAVGNDTSSSNSFIMPIEGGEITKEFSESELEYSITLDQFVVHPGVDIQAELDTPVLAANDGTIIKVFEDDKYGLSIWIDHSSGLVTKYSNLSTDKMVEEGDEVKKGDIISGVGNSAVFESLEASHLHFEAEKDGMPINPTELIS